MHYRKYQAIIIPHESVLPLHLALPTYVIFGSELYHADRRRYATHSPTSAIMQFVCLLLHSRRVAPRQWARNGTLM